MTKPFALVALILILDALCGAPAQAQTPPASDKLSSLSNQQLTKLVDEVDQFYKAALDRLFTVNNDEDERALGLKVGNELLANYDGRVAGRCTKILASQSFNQYLAVVHARMAKSQPDADKLASDFEALLAKYGLTAGDLKKTGDCAVFEYGLEPLYETPITVYDPGFWWWQKDRQTKTFLRVTVLSQKDDGSADVEAVIGAGGPKGTYRGTFKRDLHSTSIQASLLRDPGHGDPLLIDGTVEMSGQAFKDPLTGEAAPKLPARVLSGVLSVHDGDRHAINDSVMLLARESDAQISGALGGVKIPADASYGSYLDVVLIDYKGPGIGASAQKLADLVDGAYKDAQHDNPVTSFHPTRKPLFLLRDEVAFLVTDIASDVNAEAAKALRSPEGARSARALGARDVTIVPFWSVKSGHLTIQFPGQQPATLKFDGFEQLARAIFTMYAALGQEQDKLLDKFKIKAISDEIKYFQGEIAGEYKAMGPTLDALLEGRDFDAQLDGKLSAAMPQVLTAGRQLVTRLSTILDSLDGPGFTDAYAAYVKQQEDILALAAAGAPPERADATKETLARFSDQARANLDRAEKLRQALASNAEAIRDTLDYMNTFTVHVELGGIYVGDAGSLKTWTWKWDRTLSPSLEAFLTGEKSVTDTARRGD